MKKQDATENQQLVNNTLQQWLGFKRFVLKAFSQEPITPEDEQEFLEIKSQVNKATRLLNERLKGFGFEGEKIGSILRQCISISQLRAMPVPERRGLYKEWHCVYVNVNQSLGSVEFLGEGWIPKIIEAKSGTSIADIKSQTGKARTQKKKGKAGTVITVVIVLGILGAAAYFLFGQG